MKHIIGIFIGLLLLYLMVGWVQNPGSKNNNTVAVKIDTVIKQDTILLNNNTKALLKTVSIVKNNNQAATIVLQDTTILNKNLNKEQAIVLPPTNTLLPNIKTTALKPAVNLSNTANPTNKPTQKAADEHKNKLADNKKELEKKQLPKTPNQPPPQKTTEKGIFGGTILESKNITSEEAYKSTLEEVYAMQKQLTAQYNKAKNEGNKAEINEVLIKASQYLEEVIPSDIIHYWYGTAFDKEGTAETPRAGSGIACSYFVTTILREAGFSISRSRVAQKGALELAQTLCNQQLTHCNNAEEAYQLVKTKGKGLYFIAFSHHVGLIYHDGQEAYLIHSSPLAARTVARVKMEGARSFEYSKYYDIGKMSDNLALVEKWFTLQKIK